MTDLESFEKRVGTTLCGKWKLEKLLGVGGMAAVYVGVHKIGRREAIKILHPEVARSKDLRARFEQEAQAVNRFKHPGAVEIRDIDVAEDGAPFLVMELLEGESLAERARGLGGLPVDEVLRLTDELLDVLAAAHAEGIIHRDIKLDNLFLQTDGRLKVLDFGIARVRDGAFKTRTGATLGTVAYMPPEQVKGIDIDARADLFAVGATMFRVLSKRRIHDAASEPDMLVKMATLPAPPLALVVPTIAPGVALVVDRALAFQRDRRYPDALTMQADVRAVRRGEPPPFATERRAAGDDPGATSIPGSGAQPAFAPTPTAANLPNADAPTVAPGLGAPTLEPTAAQPGASAPGPRDLPTRTAATAAASIRQPQPPPSFAGHARQKPNDAIVLVVIAGVVVLLGVGIGLAWALHKPSNASADAPAADPTSSTDVPSSGAPLPRLHVPILKLAPSGSPDAPVPQTPTPQNVAPSPAIVTPPAAAPPPAGPSKPPHGKGHDKH